MKKLLIVFLVLGFMLSSGCQNNKNSVDEMTTDKHDHFSLPNVISVTIDDLKVIGTAVETMSQDEFNIYMISNYSGKYINGMHSIENTKIILKEFEETTIPVLDGDINNITNLSLYRDDNLIQQLIIYDSEEIQRSSVWVYTVDSENIEVLEFGEEVEIISHKTIETDRYTANLYETRNADYNFYGEAAIDGSYIVLRSGGIETMEEFEECFSRLEFRKIGDLLNEIPEETTENALSENEQTAVTENVYVVETTLPEPTQEVTVE